MVSLSFIKNIKYLDKILLDKNSNIITHSISDINFIKGHNLFINKYKILNAKNFYLLFYFKLIKNLLFFFSYSLYKIIFSFNYKKINNINKRNDVIFISHYVEYIKNDNYKNDFYYSSIPYILSKNNISNSIIYFKDKKYKKKYNINPKNSFFRYDINFISILKIIISIFKEFFRLISIIKINKIHNKIICLCILNLFKISTLKNNIVANEFENNIKLLKPKIIIITHEGHPFERLFFNIAKKYKIPSIGYVTGIFLPFQYGNNRDLKINFNPDYISYQSNIIKSLSNDKIKTKKIILGNKRNTEVSFNITKEYLSMKILVIPEGLIDEELFFFKNVFSFAKKNNKINYRIRLHPLSDFRKILKKLKITKIPNNITLSNNNIDSDLEICNFALYRGSTAIIHAAKKGLIPLYLKRYNEISINPLYKLEKNIIEVNNFETINTIYRDKNFAKKYEIKLKQIIQYCKEYFEEINIKPIIKILNINV